MPPPLENSATEFRGGGLLLIWLPQERLASLAGAGSLSDADVADSQSLGQFLADKGIVVRVFRGEGVRITITDEAETDRLLAALGM